MDLLEAGRINPFEKTIRNVVGRCQGYEAFYHHRHLRGWPKERGFTTDEAIRPHIEYNQWIGRNRGKYQLFIDTENQTPDETAERIAAFITELTE